MGDLVGYEIFFFAPRLFALLRASGQNSPSRFEAGHRRSVSQKLPPKKCHSETARYKLGTAHSISWHTKHTHICKSISHGDNKKIYQIQQEEKNTYAFPLMNNPEPS